MSNRCIFHPTYSTLMCPICADDDRAKREAETSARLLAAGMGPAADEVRKAITCLEARDANKAIRILKKELEQRRGHAWGWLVLAEAQRAKGEDCSDALERANRFADIDLLSLEVHHARADSKRFDAALFLATEFVRHAPGAPGRTYGGASYRGLKEFFALAITPAVGRVELVRRLVAIWCDQMAEIESSALASERKYFSEREEAREKRAARRKAFAAFKDSIPPSCPDSRKILDSCLVTADANVDAMAREVEGNRNQAKLERDRKEQEKQQTETLVAGGFFAAIGIVIILGIGAMSWAYDACTGWWNTSGPGKYDRPRN